MHTVLFSPLFRQNYNKSFQVIFQNQIFKKSSTFSLAARHIYPKEITYSHNLSHFETGKKKKNLMRKTAAALLTVVDLKERGDRPPFS